VHSVFDAKAARYESVQTFGPPDIRSPVRLQYSLTEDSQWFSWSADALARAIKAGQTERYLCNSNRNKQVNVPTVPPLSSVDLLLALFLPKAQNESRQR
jgi:hypothetical protein